MTHHQFGTLKHLLNHQVDLEAAEWLNLATFGSLIQRGWVERHGSNLNVTEEGLKAYDNYKYAAGNFRKVNTELSDRVRTMLHIARLQEAKKKLA